MARLYADECFRATVVAELRKLGHDVVTMHEIGTANRRRPDRDVVAAAASLDRLVITSDRHDYLRLHRAGVSHAGIVTVTEEPHAGALARRVHAALNAAGDLRGRLLRVTRGGSEIVGSAPNYDRTRL